MDKYAMRKLSQQELAQIREMLLADPSLQVELDMRRDIADGVTLVGNRQLRTMLDKIHDDVVGLAKSGRSWKVWLTAGVITALAAVLGYLLVFNNINTPPQPVMQYASYYTPVETTNRSEAASSDLEQSYLRAYKAEDFAAVVALLKPVLDQASNEQRLVAAIAAMEIGDYTLASTQLEKITVSDDFYYVDHAKWYQALLYLELEQRDEAKVLLQSLASDSKADHSNDAKSLLKTLK